MPEMDVVTRTCDPNAKDEGPQDSTFKDPILETNGCTSETECNASIFRLTAMNEVEMSRQIYYKKQRENCRCSRTQKSSEIYLVSCKVY